VKKDNMEKEIFSGAVIFRQEKEKPAFL